VAGIKPKREWVPLDRLVREAGLQMRASLPDGLTDPATVDRYYEAIVEGEEFPPLEVVSDSQTYWLFDGFQRAAAIERAGKGSAECLVFTGSHQDALLRAIAANARHGLTRTTNDCRRALTTLLDTSDMLQRVLAQALNHGGVHRALAATCSISKGLVYKVLEERNLRVVGGKLVRKRATPPQEIDTRTPTQRVGSNTHSHGDSPRQESEQSDKADDPANTNPHSSLESQASQELERTRNAIASIWHSCRKLLDGPFAMHLLRFAANHNIPFSREGTTKTLLTTKPSGEILSAIAWWEPLGKMEAVLSDLAAIVSAGLDPLE
jgi:hypothetical protein